MIGLIAWAVAIVLAAGIVAVLMFELSGHRRRFRAALAEARADLQPRYVALTASVPRTGSSGRHRAEAEQ